LWEYDDVTFYTLPTVREFWCAVFNAFYRKGRRDHSEDLRKLIDYK